MLSMNGPNIIAVIPTNKRAAVLSRAFTSVELQTMKPDLILIVIEEGNDISQIEISDRVKIITNERMRSLSGAVNHALGEIAKLCAENDWDETLTWIALLDDDDWWDPRYIEKCVHAMGSDSQQIVAGLIRYDIANPSGMRLPIPKILNKESFLAKNPNIQGSNLFLRMDAFVEVRGFDESLLSCTDRDICTRLFDRERHQWVRIDEHLVHHDATSSGRISDAGSHRKKMGLLKFAEKYRNKMSHEIWEEFLDVAMTRFEVDLRHLND